MRFDAHFIENISVAIEELGSRRPPTFTHVRKGGHRRRDRPKQDGAKHHCGYGSGAGKVTHLLRDLNHPQKVPTI